MFSIMNELTGKCLNVEGRSPVGPKPFSLMDCLTAIPKIYRGQTTFYRQFWSLAQDDGDNSDDIARIFNANTCPTLMPKVECGLTGTFPETVEAYTMT